MMPYVEAISTDVHFAEKSYGTYTVIDAQPGALTVKNTMKAGHQMSYHYHERKDEVWTIVSGTGKTIVDGMEQTVRPGDVVTIAAGCKHMIVADTDLSLIEVQVGDELTLRNTASYWDGSKMRENPRGKYGNLKYGKGRLYG